MSARGTTFVEAVKQGIDHVLNMMSKYSPGGAAPSRQRTSSESRAVGYPFAGSPYLLMRIREENGEEARPRRAQSEQPPAVPPRELWPNPPPPLPYPLGPRRLTPTEQSPQLAAALLAPPNTAQSMPPAAVQPLETPPTGVYKGKRTRNIPIKSSKLRASLTVETGDSTSSSAALGTSTIPSSESLTPASSSAVVSSSSALGTSAQAITHPQVRQTEADTDEEVDKEVSSYTGAIPKTTFGPNLTDTETLSQKSSKEKDTGDITSCDKSSKNNSNLLEVLGLKTLQSDDAARSSILDNDYYCGNHSPYDPSQWTADDGAARILPYRFSPVAEIKPISVAIPQTTTDRPSRCFKKRRDLLSPVGGAYWCTICKYDTTTGMCEHGLRVNQRTPTKRAAGSPIILEDYSGDSEILNLSTGYSRDQSTPMPLESPRLTTLGNPMPTLEDEMAAGPSNKYRDATGVVRYYSDGKACPASEDYFNVRSVTPLAGPSGVSYRPSTAERTATTSPDSTTTPDSTENNNNRYFKDIGR